MGNRGPTFLALAEVLVMVVLCLTRCCGTKCMTVLPLLAVFSPVPTRHPSKQVQRELGVVEAVEVGAGSALIEEGVAVEVGEEAALVDGGGEEGGVLGGGVGGGAEVFGAEGGVVAADLALGGDEDLDGHALGQIVGVGGDGDGGDAFAVERVDPPEDGVVGQGEFAVGAVEGVGAVVLVDGQAEAGEEGAVGVGGVGPVGAEVGIADEQCAAAFAEVLLDGVDLFFGVAGVVGAEDDGVVLGEVHVGEVDGFALGLALGVAGLDGFGDLGEGVAVLGEEGGEL